MYLNLVCAQKQNGDGTYDAEVYIALTDREGKIIAGTQQRTIKKGCATREIAENMGHNWVIGNLFPVVEALPKAQA